MLEQAGEFVRRGGHAAADVVEHDAQLLTGHGALAGGRVCALQQQLEHVLVVRELLAALEAG